MQNEELESQLAALCASNLYGFSAHLTIIPESMQNEELETQLAAEERRRLSLETTAAGTASQGHTITSSATAANLNLRNPHTPRFTPRVTPINSNDPPQFSAHHPGAAGPSPRSETSDAAAVPGQLYGASSVGDFDFVPSEILSLGLSREDLEQIMVRT